jgi:multidrug efflux pump subunit AcrB
VGIALGLALVSLVLYYFNGREFYPETKSGTMQMHLRAPLGTRIEASGRIATRISKEISKMLPGQVDTVVSNCGLPVGPHNLAFIPTPTIGSQDCDLTIALKNDKSPVWDYRRTLRKGLKARYPGTVFTFQPADLTTKILNFGTPSPIDVQVKGFDLEANYEFARKLAGKLRHIPGAVDVTIQQTMQTPTLMVQGKRMFALGMDLAEKEIAGNMLLTTSGSQQVDQLFWLDLKTGISYRINIYVPQPQVARIQDLQRTPVNIPGSEPADKKTEILGNVANVSAVGTPGQVTHGDIMPLFDVYVSAEQRDLGHVLSDVQKVTKDMNKDLPKQASLEIHGQAETMHQAYIQLVVGIVLAVALVYLIIVVNFQSWLDPFIIISALPGALAGIAWSLFITHTYLSVPALTGAIMTMGTATANSILVVSHARERLAEHNDAFRAALEAGKARIRPVLMTASAMIFGMLPMSMGNSPNAPLGRAVIGGLFVATVFTLFFVPCVYSIMYRGHTGKDKDEK